VEPAVIARPKIFVLHRVPPRPFQADGLCACCGMGATAARAWFDSPADAHFDCCMLCAELITVQALMGVALKVAAGLHPTTYFRA